MEPNPEALVEPDIDEPTVRATKMQELRKKFALFDKNGDGVLTREEITEILTRPTGSGGRQMNSRMATDFVLMFKFDKLDEDGNGTIDIDEFVQALLPSVTYAVFNEHDREFKGHVPREHLPKMLSQLSMKKGHPKHPNFDSVLAQALEETGKTAAAEFEYKDFYHVARKMSISAAAPLLAPNEAVPPTRSAKPAAAGSAQPAAPAKSAPGSSNKPAPRSGRPKPAQV